MAHGHDDRESEKGSEGSRDSGGSLDGSRPERVPPGQSHEGGHVAMVTGSLGALC